MCSADNLKTMNRAITLVIVTYTIAALTAALTFVALPHLDLIYRVLMADLTATGVVFIASAAFQNSSLYDPYWSLAPPLIGGFLLVNQLEPRLLLAVALTSLWGGRLTLNWLKTWQSLDHEDWRYRRLKSQTGRLYWGVSLFGIHLFPTVLVFLGCLSFFAIASVDPAPLGGLDILASVILLASIWVEAQADRELHHFRANRSSPSEVLTLGLWARCRHPNYLGEIGFWFGLYLFSAAALDSFWQIALIGPVAMLALFKGISIPMIEHKLLTEKPDYTQYRDKTPQLLPYGQR